MGTHAQTVPCNQRRVQMPLPLLLTQRELPQRGGRNVERGIGDAQPLALWTCRRQGQPGSSSRQGGPAAGCSPGSTHTAGSHRAAGGLMQMLLPLLLTQRAIEDGPLVVAQRAHKHEGQVAHVACGSRRA